MTFAEIKMLESLGVPKNIIQKLSINYQGAEQAAVIGTTAIDIQLSGTSRILLGIKVHSDFDPGVMQMTLSLNTEKIMDTVPVSLVDVDNLRNDLGYFPMYRRLTGRDTMHIEVTSSAATPFDITLVYLVGNNLVW